MDNFSSRGFRLWSFHVSHSQLLIRSPKQEADPHSQNIDLRFTGVFYVALDSLLWGVVIRRPDEDDVRHLQTKCSLMEDQEHRYYCLHSGGRCYFVGAARLSIEMNALGSLETGFDLP